MNACKMLVFSIFLILHTAIFAMDPKEAAQCAQYGYYQGLSLYLELGGNPNKIFVYKDGYQGTLLTILMRNFYKFSLIRSENECAIYDKLSAYVLGDPRKDYFSCLSILCNSNYKTDLNAQDSDGNTPLHILIKRTNQGLENSKQLLKVLLLRGALITIKDKKDKTVLDLAQDYHFTYKKENSIRKIFKNPQEQVFMEIVKALKDTKPLAQTEQTILLDE